MIALNIVNYYKAIDQHKAQEEKQHVLIVIATHTYGRAN
jgi:hypothetical protein